MESVAKATRRSFSTAEKLRILKKADACLASGKRGALGAMLREEGIYSSHLSTWRTQVAEASNAALAGRKPGRKAKLDAKDRRIAELEKRNAELERRLHVADVLIDLQKNHLRRNPTCLTRSSGRVPPPLCFEGAAAGFLVIPYP